MVSIVISLTTCGPAILMISLVRMIIIPGQRTCVASGNASCAHSRRAQCWYSVTSDSGQLQQQTEVMNGSQPGDHYEDCLQLLLCKQKEENIDPPSITGHCTVIGQRPGALHHSIAVSKHASCVFWMQRILPLSKSLLYLCINNAAK